MGPRVRRARSERNPRIVLARVTGFGQTGPYRSRPGFGTLAEAMSGFAAMTGEPDGPPALPPFGLADGIASLATAYAIMVALHAREPRAARAGGRRRDHRADSGDARTADHPLGSARHGSGRAPATAR